MPVQTAKSGLMAKYGSKIDQAVKKHGSDETTYGIVPLPAGISNGIAQLVECKFDTYKSGNNAGEYYFRAAAVVLEPSEVFVNGQAIPVAGLQTSIMEPVCDTKTQAGKVTTQEEHVARILNTMRTLGADTTGAGGADLERLAAALKEARPYLRFSTSVRKAQQAGQTDGVWENWHGSKGLEDYSPPEDSAVSDETGEAGPAGENPPGIDGGYTDQGDLDELAKSADGGDEEAQAKLTEMANQAGIDDAAIAGYDDWAAIVAAIKGSGEPPANDQPWEPSKGDVYKFKPMVKGPGGKQVKGKKAVEVEVLSVNKAKRTVTAKNLDDGKTQYKDVSWDDLIAE